MHNLGDLKMLTVEDIAQVCHEANKAYCETMEDGSQLPWDEAPAWQRESIIAGVNQLIKDPTTRAEESHALWMARKQKEGWVHGEKKDVEKKEHPCLLPYDQLPPEQQAKDNLFRSICRSLMPYYDPNKS